MILIGELRDAETAQTALQAAESGHLVFSTMHTIDAAETVGRMIEFFPPASSSRSAPSSPACCAASSASASCRASGRPRRRRRGDGDERAHRRADPRGAHRGDRGRGRRRQFFEMQTFQQALIELVLAGNVAREVAANAATNATTSSSRSSRRSSGRPTSSRRMRPPGGSRDRAEDGSHELRASVSRRRTRRLARGVALALALRAAARRAHVRGPRRQLRVGRPGPGVPEPEAPNRRSILLPPGALEAPSCPCASAPTRNCSQLWHRAGDAYGMPWQVLAAINEIESNFGRNMGPSSAGAVGWMQFMPDTWLRWGMDANGDGIADPWNAEDAIYCRRPLPRGCGGRTDISRAIFAYNHAEWYVDEVLGLAAMFGGDLASSDVSSRSTGWRSTRGGAGAGRRAPSSSPPPRRSRRRRRRGRSGAAAADDPSCSSPTAARAERTRSRPEQELAAATAEADDSAAELEQAQPGSSRQSGAGRRRSARRGGRPAACRRERTATSSRSAAAPTPSRSAITTTTTPLRTSPPRWARRSSPSRTGSCSRSSTTGAAAPASRSRRWTGSSRSTATSATASRPAAGPAGHRRRLGRPRRLHRPLHGAAPAPRPPARALSAGDAVVPGVRRDRVHLQDGAAEADGVTPMFALVPPEEPLEDVVEFTS